MLAHQAHGQRSIITPVSDVNAELEAVRDQVARILASETLRGSEVLRRLFRFLADKTFSGEAEQLKEYSVGLDALGKPATYDPRQDSTVRLQASRLRHKLEEYYHTEGIRDPLTIQLPKGGFKIVWQNRRSETPPSPHVSLPDQTRWRSLAIGLACTSLIATGLGAWSMLRVSRAPAKDAAISGSTPELDTLWSPFISSAHHLIIAFSNPVFVRFQREGSPDILYHERDVEGWAQAVDSPEFSTLSRALGHPSAKLSFDYAPRGELVATFVLGQFLATRRRDVSVSRVDELSWQQFADNDIIFLAPRSAVAEKEAALPVRLAFIADKSGIRNLLPLPGEPSVYADAKVRDSNGETFELVPVMPGPLGRTTVASFTGGRAWGVIGAIQSLTDPAFVRVLVRHLKGNSGDMPAAYQIVIRITYRDGTPTSTSYITHRLLTPTQRLTEPRTPEHGRE